MKILSLDIGGTNIRSAIVDGVEIWEYKKTAMPKEQRDAVRAIFGIVSSYGKFDAICVSTAGFEKNGKLMNCLNNDMNGVALTKILKAKFKKKVFVENDANCATLAEARYGMGKGRKNFILLTLGSGIGGGAILDGKLYRGQGGAIEPGSMRIAGEKFIWEDLASGNGSIFLARGKFGMSGITSQQLEEKADAGNKKAKAVYEEVGNYLGIGLANLAYIFDPEILVIGGGFSRVKYFYPSMRATFAKLYKLNPKPEIVKAKFGDDAGLIGAALLMKEK